MIGIIGAGYSGSTVLSFMLGSLPGCKTVGEDWHLMDETKRRVECWCCEDGQCPVFTPGFREGLTYRNAWERLAGILETETLIVSDKLPFLYERYLNDNDVEIDFVLLYKRPEQFVHSSMRHTGNSSRLSGLQFWTNCNRQSMEFVQRHGRRYTTCSFEDLAETPRKELARICEALDLPYDAGAVEYWNHEHHSFGGNWTAHLNIWGPDHPNTLRHMRLINGGWKQYKDRFRQIISTRHVELPFTDEEIQKIYSFPGTRAAWESLRNEGGKDA